MEMTWISIKDRLPERNKEVLLYCTWHSCDSSHIYIGYKTAKKWKFSKTEKLTGWIVTHWMPLPDKPKDGE